MALSGEPPRSLCANRETSPNQANAYLAADELKSFVESAELHFSLPANSASIAFLNDGTFSMRMGAPMSIGRWHLNDNTIVAIKSNGERYVFKFCRYKRQYLMDLQSRAYRYSDHHVKRIVTGNIK